jgi:short-subunit dehydrogenase
LPSRVAVTTSCSSLAGRAALERSRADRPSGDTRRRARRRPATDPGVALVEERIARERDLAMLVNNAGFAHFGQFVDETPEHADASVRVLVLAPVRLTRAALPVFAARGGADVVQLSSRAASRRAKLATYSAAKAYLNRFSIALADQARRAERVRVLSVCPGNVSTEVLRGGGAHPTRSGQRSRRRS